MADVAHTLDRIHTILAQYANPIVGYSGGKDSIVVHHLVERVRPGTPAYCEASFYFTRQRADVERTIAELGFDVEIGHRLTYPWLVRHRQYLFADDNGLRQEDARARQQNGVQDAARRGRHDLIVWGRRRGENTVRAEHYKTREGPQFHPLREWSTADVWRYLEDVVGIPRPWIYTTPYGPLSGNAAFYSFRLRQVGGDYDRAWELVDSLDPEIRPRYLAALAAA